MGNYVLFSLRCIVKCPILTLVQHGTTVIFMGECSIWMRVAIEWLLCVSLTGRVYYISHLLCSETINLFSASINLLPLWKLIITYLCEKVFYVDFFPEMKHRVPTFTKFDLKLNLKIRSLVWPFQVPSSNQGFSYFR